MKKHFLLMKLPHFIAIKLTIFLILGIITGFYFPFYWKTISIIIGGLFIILFVAFIYLNKKYYQKTGYNLLAYITIFFVGVLTITFHTHKNQFNHYTKKITTNQSHLIQFKVKKLLKPGEFYERYIVKLQHVGGVEVSGKSIINIEKDSAFTKLKIDGVYATKTVLKPLIHPLKSASV